MADPVEGKPNEDAVDNVNFSDLADKPYNADLEEEIDQRIQDELDKDAKDDDLDLEGDDEDLDLEDKDKKEDDDTNDEETDEQKAERENKEAEEAEANDLAERAKKLELEEGATKEQVEAKEFEIEVASYADSEKVDVEVAKRELESIKSIGEKYEHDPKKLAKAFLHIQRSESKASKELKQLKSEIEENQNRDEVTPEGIRYGGKYYEKASLVKQYRDKYPELSKNQETGEPHNDNYVYDLVKQSFAKTAKKNNDGQMQQIKEEARDRRVSIVNALTPENQKFAEGITELLGEAPDVEVVQYRQADVEDLLTFEKGRHYDKHLKEVSDLKFKEGFEKGKEDAKILEVKEDTPDTTSKGGQKPSGGKGTFGSKLSEAQKKEALDMFDDDPISDEAKFEHYFEIIKTEKEAREKIAS